MSLVAVALGLTAVGSHAAQPSPARSATIGLITTPAELAALPMSGPAWDRLKAVADGSLGSPNVGDLNSFHDVRTLAVALVYARTGTESYRQKAADAIMSAVGTEAGGLAVGVGRNLISYVVSADLIDLASFDSVREGQFRSWLETVRFRVFADGSIVSEDRKRANNHGRVAGASRLAASLYLGDTADAAEAIAILKGWMGDRSSYNAFTWKNDLSWQADPANPLGVNPAGATKNGEPIGGALPEEMRRGCSFKIPPCPTAYPWGALQAVLLAAEMLDRHGHQPYEWEDRALLRAAEYVKYLDDTYGGWWAAGDDVWQPWLVNHAYGTDFPTVPVTRLGKTFGFTDWLYGPSSGGGGPTPTAPTASFTATPTTGTAPLAVAFRDTSTGTPTSWLWSFGDGSTSTSRDPNHTYTDAGTYTVTLSVTNAHGTDEETRSSLITVSDPAPGGETRTFVATDDAYVASDAATANTGAANNLRARTSGSKVLQTYLKFTVSGVGAASDATIRLHVVDASNRGGDLFLVTDSSWTESNITWSSKPPASGTVLDSAGPVAKGAWVEWDVSDVVTGNGTYSFVLVSPSSDVVRFVSSEGAVANRPQLVVTSSAGAP